MSGTTGNPDKDKFLKGEVRAPLRRQSSCPLLCTDASAVAAATPKQDDEVDAEDKFSLFLDWLRTNGGSHDQLTLQKYADEMRGVHAAHDIVPDETICTIPLKCLITVEMGKATEVGRKVSMHNLQLDAPKHVYVMLFMLMDMQVRDVQILSGRLLPAQFACRLHRPAPTRALMQPTSRIHAGANAARTPIPSSALITRFSRPR